jgi:hypothetical protein
MRPDALRRRASPLFYAAAFFILTAGLFGAAAAEQKASVARPAQTETSPQTPIVEWGD